ncbi:MAG: VWA domain-containing protein, partial [Nanoarchaeota archaeon]|nr:VWA domain-containing protein [Nanoarchaeota archaeon]
NQPNCESCGGICQSMAYDSKDANKLFVDIILNTSNSRIGLVGYKEQAYAEDYHALSRDVVSLKDKIDSWQAVGATCICCGVNSAVDDLVSDSTSDKFRSLIVMSDGQANRPCSEQGGGSATQNAIQSACDAYNNHGIVVYTIGFGPQADEATLESMAQCANGTYTYSTIEGLEQIYQQIANEILTTYAEQTVDVAGGVYMKLFPDSYIEFDYNNTVELYGLVITAEEEFDNAYSGSFYVPSGAEVLEVEVASYSGPRWTDNVKIDGNDVYMLSDYGSDYILLGDPYIINIPASLVFEGDNFVNVTTGTSPTNSSAGSESNKIIYTLKRNASAFSDIEPVAYGCNWRIQFEDDSDMEVTIPSSYVDGSVCVYNETSHDLQDWNDAYNSAVWELLSNLDLDSDGKIDLIFTEQQLEISLSETSGIPIVLEAEVQARIWY